MRNWVLFPLVGVMALLAGGAFWFGSTRNRNETSTPPDITPAALYAASFTDQAGQPQPIGRFQGKLLVLNFWATWCGPCRKEMPGFARLQSRWASRGVQFLGISDEDPRKVAAFIKEVPVGYPLWTGRMVTALGKRLGNGRAVLPYTVLVSPSGQVLETRVGTYAEDELERRLVELSGK